MPKIESRISLGNLLVMLTIAGSFFVGWGVMTTTVSGLQDDISQLESAQGTLTRRVRDLEMGQAVAKTSLDAINSGINDLKAEQAELNRLLRTLLQSSR